MSPGTRPGGLGLSVLGEGPAAEQAHRQPPVWRVRHALRLGIGLPAAVEDPVERPELGAAAAATSNEQPPGEMLLERAEAQLAKLNLYFKPARCTDVKFLGDAPDRCEALGRDITRPIDEDRRLLALHELVPRGLADLMTTQVSLKSYPDALTYARRHMTDQRHGFRSITGR